MCGRYATSRSPDELRVAFDAVLESEDDVLEPDFNVAPTKPVYGVRAGVEGAARRLGVFTWGLVPSWAADRRVGAKFINARAESVSTTPAFRSAYRRRRCLIPADGWYEWAPRPAAAGKQAYYMTAAAPLVFAGLYEVWGEERLRTCTILTTESTGQLAEVHDRMPLILDSAQWSAWLGEEPADLAELLVPASIDDIEVRAVGPAVGDWQNNGRSLTQSLADPADAVLF
jgi:putative SOS response-associated peptidase YedK